MASENLQNETKIRRFLLSGMSDAERTAFEESFITDEDLFEQMRVVEDELIEQYVRGTLAVSEREMFEKNFSMTEKRRERISFMRSFLDKISEQSSAVKKNETEIVSISFWEKLNSFFKIPKLVFGAVLTILLLISGFWFLISNLPKTENEIAKEVTPTPTVTNLVSPTPVENNSNAAVPNNLATNKNPVNANRENPDRNQSVPNVNKPEKETPPLQKVIVAIALFPGTTRSEGKTGELNLPKDAKGANLQLNLESSDYKIYRAEIVNPDGVVIFRSGRLNARGTKINTFVPGERLLRGDYLVKLYGFNAQNREESVADYQFRVNRK